MRFHEHRDKRLHPPAAPARRSFKKLSSRSDGPSQQVVIADDSPMITACYQAHLDMTQMLWAFAELRGDAHEDAAA
jgi:hypothetical protein